MNILIRNEKEHDREEIYQLIKEGFKRALKADGDEQDFAVKLQHEHTKKYVLVCKL